MGGGGSTGNKMVLEGPSEEVILQPRPERWAGAAKGGAGRIVQVGGNMEREQNEPVGGCIHE